MIKTSIPGFCSPTAFIMPLAVSMALGVGNWREKEKYCLFFIYSVKNNTSIKKHSTLN